MSGISSKAAGKLENRYKFNDGTELNNSFDISLYETDFRLYDHQIGRFVQPDELGEVFDDWSPYTFANDNPILLNDPTGLAADTVWKPLPEVIMTSTVKKSAASSGGSTMINGPGQGIRKNTNLEELTTQPYIGYAQTRADQWDPAMTKVLASDIKESALLFVPWGRVGKGAAWMYRLNKVRQVIGIARFAYASRLGIRSYKLLKSLNTVAGTEVHHLIEKRFATLFWQAEKDMASIVLTEGEHQIITNAWRAEIGYNGSNAAVTTFSATKTQVESAARRIYAEYPDILNALGL